MGTIPMAYLVLQALAPVLTSGPRRWLSAVPAPIVAFYAWEAAKHAQAPTQAVLTGFALLPGRHGCGTGRFRSAAGG
jgi:hypothetical protein